MALDAAVSTTSHYLQATFCPRDLDTRRGSRSGEANEAHVASNFRLRCVFKIESRIMIAPRTYVAYQSGSDYTQASVTELRTKKKKKRNIKVLPLLYTMLRKVTMVNFLFS